MSKTYIYLIVLFGVYLFIVKGVNLTNEKSTVQKKDGVSYFNSYSNNT